MGGQVDQSTLSTCDHRAVPALDLTAAEIAKLEATAIEAGVRRLAVFGSALRGELRDDSDVDVLVDFVPGRTPGLLGVARLELALEAIFGREVEARTYEDLSPHFRDRVRDQAEELYAA